MVKPGTENPIESSNGPKYTGVRKRKWGKYVSEIRLPNSRERIWLGSYDTAEKAARAFDAALFCLRGKSAKFNFPDNPPNISGGRSLAPPEIQVAAARFANSEPEPKPVPSQPNVSHLVDNTVNSNINQMTNSYSFSSTSSEMQADSPDQSVSYNAMHTNSHDDMALDNTFVDHFAAMGSGSTNVTDYGIFPGFDDLNNDYFMPSLLSIDYGEEDCDTVYQQDSFLWNF